MCQAHGSDCAFPPSPESNQRNKGASRRGKAIVARSARQSSVTAAPSNRTNELSLGNNPLSSTSQPPSTVLTEAPQIHDMAISLDQEEDDDSPHIVGPALTSDNHVLADYLSTVSGARGGTRGLPIIRPMMGGDSEPVMFTKVMRRPLGMAMNPSPPSLQLQAIEKLVEPWTDQVVDMYMGKTNICFPLLDEASFRDQYLNARGRISPALLSCLYAHSLSYWQYDAHLSSQRCPDGRFVWNLACQILYSELQYSPGMATIAAMLLNAGGRPSTSMIGNGVLLGAAVSISYSLGLNRNPLSWHIPQSEKYLRMKIWWCLLIHDRWYVLAYGTPPRLRREHYDVPSPTHEYLSTSKESQGAEAVFISVVGLSEVLEGFLDYVYLLPGGSACSSVSELELSLDRWIDSLAGDVRKIIIRGTHLGVHGASNLRLAYLSIRLLLRRIELNNHKQSTDSDPEKLSCRYVQVRRTAEDIVLLVQELDARQLGDFWLPMSAFTFSHTATLLIRCALETEEMPAALAKSPSLLLASELLKALRSHQRQHGWDLGDICLAQHSDVVDKLLTPDPSEDPLANPFPELQCDFMPDFPFMDDFFLGPNPD
ncbi:hypothetical protein SODALDRAFT_269195 [Sodiomyces alkalinus F11]|uniref:Xylanolytic transcriptional activator regulatory domain-containing protein n=1 Tax=Sodiomyces alkalinus (strain CBS 110278 / VKM F-3762 / F11) TaxID=1314773 RepID=A0A3N2Q5L1_SODAK|nr:hypothetical protein SODALDRAFT_269195 [Sodiomyces alkalinus F11]ROT42063.1 hypothetical protein SODALDRAFT_269195 [Sodiomyces alkalinus F11]